jgi:DNA polymerase III gamma/tau subunit
MRDALSLLDKVLSLGPNAELAFILRILGIANISKLEKFAELIFNQQTTLIPEFIKELYEEGVDFITFNKDFLEYLRKILIVKVFQSNSDWGLTSNQITVLENLSQTQTEIKIITIIRLFLRALKEQNFSPSLDLPVLLAGIEASINSSAVLPNVKKKLNPVVTASNIPNLQISTDKNLTEALDSQLSVENINEKWEEFVKKVKSINGPLANLLRTAQILRVNHYKVFISVKYQFHKQNLEQAKNNDLITKILHEVYNYPLTLIAEVKENQASDLPRVEDLSNALKVFGGELVE